MFGLSGAGWMTFVLYLGSSLLVTISNYPGQLLAEWARTWWGYYRGGSPGGISSEPVWIKIWLVVTSCGSPILQPRPKSRRFLVEQA